jgi:UDP-2,3-diacylglucosamine pyrophosphatase LpxH
VDNKTWGATERDLLYKVRAGPSKVMTKRDAVPGSETLAVNETATLIMGHRHRPVVLASIVALGRWRNLHTSMLPRLSAKCLVFFPNFGARWWNYRRITII